MSQQRNQSQSVTPVMTFKNSKKAIEFYKQAFGAEVLNILPMLHGDGTMHASIKIGNSIIMMSDENPSSEQCAKSAESLGASPISLYIYVSNVDDAFKNAIKAGGTETMPVMDMFWGDRAGQIRDPFGYMWMLATHQKDLTNEEIMQGAEDFMAKMSHI